MHRNFFNVFWGKSACWKYIFHYLKYSSFTTRCKSKRIVIKLLLSLLHVTMLLCVGHFGYNILYTFFLHDGLLNVPTLYNLAPLYSLSIFLQLLIISLCNCKYFQKIEKKILSKLIINDHWSTNNSDRNSTWKWGNESHFTDVISGLHSAALGLRTPSKNWLSINGAGIIVDPLLHNGRWLVDAGDTNDRQTNRGLAEYPKGHLEFPVEYYIQPVTSHCQLSPTVSASR